MIVKLLYLKLLAKILMKKRHLRVRDESIRNLISHGVISLDFVRSENNIADPLTKGLTRQQVLESSRGMRLEPIT